MTNADAGKVVYCVINTLAESNEPIAASTITMTCEVSGVCTNMEAFALMQRLVMMEVLEMNGHLISKGKEFGTMQTYINQVADAAAQSRNI